MKLLFSLATINTLASLSVFAQSLDNADSTNSSSSSSSKYTHVPNAYCQYYASGGDGTCENGRSFDEVWQLCEQEGTEKCMGVMWNSCTGPTSDTTVNGTWKLMTAGQEVGNADHPTDTCGTGYGHWDAFVRKPSEEQIIIVDIPDMSGADIEKVMNWISAETVMVKNPFCWKDSYGRGVGTTPHWLGNCYEDGYERGTGWLCYPKCRSGFDGFGPVCWGTCDNSMVNCGLSCAKTTADCALAAPDQAISTLMLAANIATLGLATPATAGASATLQIAGKTVAGTTNAGKALVKAVTTLQTVKPSGLANGATVVQRIVDVRTGATKRTIKTTAKIEYTQYKAMKQFRQAFAEDFASQTSAEIEEELDSHFNPKTANFLKQLWAERTFNEIVEANDWQITGSVLSAASIVDITGVTGVVPAYAKPVCSENVPFPCITSSWCQRTMG